MPTQNLTFQCPYMAIEEIKSATGIPGDKLLGTLVQALGSEYHWRHFPEPCPSDAPAQQAPTLLEQLIVLIDKEHESEKDKLIDALDHETIDGVNSCREELKAIEQLGRLLKGMLAFEQSELEGILDMDKPDASDGEAA